MASNNQSPITEVKDSVSASNSAAPSVPPVSVSSVNGSRMNLQLMEPNNASSILPESGIPQLPSASRETIKNGDRVMEFKPVISGLSRPSRPTDPTASNVSILSDSSETRNKNVMNQNVTKGLDPTGIFSGARTMIQTPGMSQQVKEGIQQPFGVSSSNMSNMPLKQQTTGPLQSELDNYVRVWEGDLLLEGDGQPEFLTKLKGYRMRAASDTLAEDWQPKMQIVRVISQDHTHNKKYVLKADFLIFWALNQHEFLGQLQEKKLCAVIQLPSQTLLLSVSDKANSLFGMLFLGYLPSLLSPYITALDIGENPKGFETMGGTPMAIHMPNMISPSTALPAAQSVVSLDQSGITSMVGSGSFVGTTQISRSTNLGSTMSGNSYNVMSRPLVSPQLAVGMGQSPGQGNISGGQIQQSGVGVHKNKMTFLGPTGTSSWAGTIIPTRGMSMKVQAGLQPLGVVNVSMSDMPNQTSGALQSAPAKLVKFWEGSLYGMASGQPVFITKLEGYRKPHASGSEMFAVDWPPTMQVCGLHSLDNVTFEYIGKGDLLVFRVLNPHEYLRELQKNKLYAVIELPSQFLILFVSDKEGCCLHGKAFPAPLAQQQQQQQQQQQHVRPPAWSAGSESEGGSTSTYSYSNQSDSLIHTQSRGRQVGDSRLAKKPKI